MNHTEGFFPGADGVELYYQAWQPAEPAKAVLIIAHGLGEHSGRYQNVVEALVPQRYAIYALDHRGYGRSPGQRGHINEWAEYREDLRRFVQMVQEKEAERPLFLMGHSMGGCIALNYAEYYPDGLQGVVASAPAVGKLDIPTPLAVMSKLLSSVWPTLSVSSGLDVEAISRDTAVIEAYQNDPLVHDKGTPRLATELDKAAQETLARAGEFQPPLLLLHGDADR
ncbi:MAG TPA: alpha/beta hydrolase, partial [Chloroflexi bacterium]|nr:alpha/beta hydrolase [Chloroflexota bacterium]